MVSSSTTGAGEFSNAHGEGASEVMPPHQRRAGQSVDVASQEGRNTAGNTGRARSWQCYALAAFLSAAMALMILARLANSAAILSRGGFAGVLSGSSESFPDVEGPASRHVRIDSPAPLPAGVSASPSSTVSPSTTPTSSVTPSPSMAGHSSLLLSSPLVPTGWRVVRTYPHDRAFFTQGLAWRGRNLIEGTGLNYQSKLLVQRLQGTERAPAVVAESSLPSAAFGEGIVPWPPVLNEADLLSMTDDDALKDASVFQLTWKEATMFTWKLASFLPGQSPSSGLTSTAFHSTANEGWGLTTDGHKLLMTDGSAYIHWWDNPAQLAGATQSNTPISISGRTAVTDRVRDTVPNGLTVSRPSGIRRNDAVHRLNELEYAHGWLLSNIWYDPRVAIIHPATGAVVWYLDFTQLLNENQGSPGADCLNGMAYTTRLDVDPTYAAQGTGKDPRIATEAWGGRLWITGKKWPRLYEIELTGLVPADQLGDWTGLRDTPEPWARRASKKGKKAA